MDNIEFDDLFEQAYLSHPVQQAPAAQNVKVQHMLRRLCKDFFMAGFTIAQRNTDPFAMQLDAALAQAFDELRASIRAAEAMKKASEA